MRREEGRRGERKGKEGRGGEERRRKGSSFPGRKVEKAKKGKK